MCWHQMPRDTRASLLVFESIACQQADQCLLSSNSALVCLIVSMLVSRLLAPFPCSFTYFLTVFGTC